MREWAASPRFQGSARCFTKLQAMWCSSTCLFALAGYSLSPSTTCQPRFDAQYSTWYDATRGRDWVVVVSIVYFRQGGRHGLRARTSDLWGRLLQGEQWSTAAVGWAGRRVDGGGWHTRKQRSPVPFGGWCAGTMR